MALRTLHYDAVSPAKVSLVIFPGAELTVPDDVADQLVATSAQFKEGARPAAPVVKAPAKPAADKAPAKKPRKRIAKK